MLRRAAIAHLQEAELHERAAAHHEAAALQKEHVEHLQALLRLQQTERARSERA